MSSTKLRDDMMEYIESKSEVKKSISPRTKDKNKELLKDLDEPTDEHQPGQTGSRVVIDQGNSSNGCYSQKNQFQIPSKETEDGISTVNGNSIPTSGKIVSDVEPLKQNGSRGLDIVNISNGVSRNGFQVQSLGDGTSEKYAKNGLNGEATEDASDNGEDVTKRKSHANQPVGTSMRESEKPSNSFSVSSAESSKPAQNEAPKQNVAMEDTVRQKNELKKGSGKTDLVMEGVESDKYEYCNSGDESTASTASNAAQNKPTDSETRIRFASQVLQHINSSEMQMKMKEIDNLVEHMATLAFKPSTSTVGDETKPGSPESESADKSEPEDEESTFSKRTSKQSELEDPEELRMISKKLKMSKTADSTLETESGSESDSWVPKQVRLAYEKVFREVPPGQGKKGFNFAGTGESSKEMSKDDLNEIAEKVLRAMSVEHCFLRQEIDESFFEIGENRTDGIHNPSGIQAEKELERKLAPEGYCYVWFSEDTYPKVRISPKEAQPLHSSCDKRDSSKARIGAFSRCPSDQGEAANSTSRRVRRETSDRRVQRFPNLFELIKTVFLFCCLVPFFLTTCATMKLFDICFPTKNSLKRPKTLNRERSDEDESPN